MMTTVMAGEGDLATIIDAYRDVTERLKRSHEMLTGEVCRLREELREKNKELARRERLAVLGEMAAGIAHEIRNPLGGIGLYASLLVRDLEDRPSEQQIARRIGEGVGNLEGIVGDILAFSRDAQPRRRRCPLAGVLDSALTQCALRAEKLGIAVDVDLRLTRCEVFCDPGQLERALVNLLLNAIEAAGKGGRVWIRSGGNRRQAGLVAIVVEDNGPGIPDGLTERVFDPFFTTKDTGTGLGLAIVHRIAESHGGTVAVGKRKGGGAAFVLLLPLPQGRVEKSHQREEMIDGEHLCSG